MKDKIKMGLVLTLCLLLCFVIQYFSAFVFDFIIFALSFFSVTEMKNIQMKSGAPCFNYAPEIACFLIFVGAFTGFLCGLSAIIILLIVFAIILVFYFVLFLGSFLLFPKELEKDVFRKASNMTNKQFSLFKTNNTLTCIFYPTMMLFFVYFINHISEIGLVSFIENTKGAAMGLFGLILLFSITCFTDTFAMIFGTLIKGKKLCPKISPKKTISGACLGLVGGIIGASIVYFIFNAVFSSVFHAVYFWQFIVIGFVGSLVAQAGDIFESYLKRRAGVKDSGNFFRSHGGFLDRLDSAIFVGPYVFICLIFLFG